MKFIHCADLHLDQPFRGLGKLPVNLGTHLQEVNRRILTNIVDLGISEAVDVVLIVGDTFHQAVPTIQTQQLVIAEFERLREAGIPVILTFGNHDYYQQETYWFEFPDNVHCLTTEEVTTITLETGSQERVAFSGFSYESPGITSEKVLEFPLREPEVTYHFGLYHGQQGRSGEHNYAPFQLSQMQELGYDYWALGHIHQSLSLTAEPPIVYPGTPVGHRKNETMTKGVVLGECHRHQMELTWIPQEGVTWLTHEVDCGQVTDSSQLLGAIQTAIKEVLAKRDLHQLMAIQLVSLPSEMKGNVRQQLANGELLDYLQRVIYQESHEGTWLYELTMAESEEPIQWPLGTDTEALRAVLAAYREPTAVGHILAPLMRQIDLGEILSQDDEFIENTLKKVMSELGIK